MKVETQKFLEKVSAELPGVKILTRDEERLIYAHGCYPLEYKWILQGKYQKENLPSAVVMPTTTEEVSKIMKWAYELDLPVIPFGGGSGIVGGSIAENDEVMIDIKELRHYSINTQNCTAIGGGGLTGCDFENLLAQDGYTSGQFPQSFQSAVLGGMVATRAIGTFSTKYGKMDDMVNALEVVLPNGDIYQSHSTPKASTGPNLDELFLGSEGVYGIVTKVEMKIYPKPEAQYFEAYTFPTTEQGLEAIRKFIQSNVTPAVVRLYDEEEAIEKMAKYNFEEGCAFLIMGYEGMAEQVELEKKYVKKFCLEHGGLWKGPGPGYDWFHSRFSTKKMLDYDAMSGGTADAIEVSAPWDCLPDVWREMRKALAPLCESIDCHFSHVYHTGASVYVIFHSSTGGDNEAGAKRYLECLDTAIRTSLKYGGNVSHHHGSGKAKAAYLRMEHGDVGYACMQKIKDTFDPKGLVNKGVLGL